MSTKNAVMVSSASESASKNQPQSALVFKLDYVEQLHKLSDAIKTEAQAAKNDKVRRFWKKKYTLKAKKYSYK